MKILITNDDGIGAGGIRALEEVASEFGETISIAPDRHLSGCAHQLTLDRELQLDEVETGRFQLDGMPADCVRVAVARFGPFDWVLSGINQGANLGVDLPVSGTVAAAREACHMSIPAIALSQYLFRLTDGCDWQHAKNYARRVLADLFQRVLQPGHFWNVNFPDGGEPVPAIVDCPVDQIALPNEYQIQDGTLRFRGDYHERVRRAGTDVDHCFSGKITVSRCSTSCATK